MSCESSSREGRPAQIDVLDRLAVVLTVQVGQFLVVPNANDGASRGTT